MIVFREYDEKNRVDKIWYDSSNIVYSECYDTPNELKTLLVVFKNGGTYKYKDVNVQDYVMFVHGGTANSNGKALNKFIKPHCEFEKMENTSLEKLQNELNEKFKEREEEKQMKDVDNEEDVK